MDLSELLKQLNSTNGLTLKEQLSTQNTNFIELLFQSVLKNGWAGLSLLTLLQAYIYLSLGRIKDFFEYINTKISYYGKHFLETSLEKVHKIFKKSVNDISSYLLICLTTLGTGLSVCFWGISIYNAVAALFGKKKEEKLAISVKLNSELNEGFFTYQISPDNTIDMMGVSNFLLGLCKEVGFAHQAIRKETSNSKTLESFDIPHRIDWKICSPFSTTEKKEIECSLNHNIGLKLNCETDSQQEILKNITYSKDAVMVMTTGDDFDKITKEWFANSGLQLPDPDIDPNEDFTMPCGTRYDVMPKIFFQDQTCVELLRLLYITDNWPVLEQFHRFMGQGPAATHFFHFNGTTYGSNGGSWWEGTDKAFVDSWSEQFKKYHISMVKVWKEKVSNYDELLSRIRKATRDLFNCAGIPRITLTFRDPLTLRQDTPKLLKRSELAEIGRRWINDQIAQFYTQQDRGTINRVSIYKLSINRKVEKVSIINPKYNEWLKKNGFEDDEDDLTEEGKVQDDEKGSKKGKSKEDKEDKKEPEGENDGKEEEQDEQEDDKDEAVQDSDSSMSETEYKKKTHKNTRKDNVKKEHKTTKDQRASPQHTSRHTTTDETTKSTKSRRRRGKQASKIGDRSYSSNLGDPGYSGNSGYSGYSGKSGYPGYPSSIGYKGYEGQEGYDKYDGSRGQKVKGSRVYTGINHDDDYTLWNDNVISSQYNNHSSPSLTAFSSHRLSPFGQSNYYSQFQAPPSKKLTINKYIPEVNSSLIKTDKKPIEYLYLAKTIEKQLTSYLQTFKEGKAQYDKYGFPYRGGLLLSGVPGCGKSTAILAVATYLNKDIYYIDLGQLRTNTELKMLMDYIKGNSKNGGIIIFEDIDCMSSIVLQRFDKTGKAIVPNSSITEMTKTQSKDNQKNDQETDPIFDMEADKLSLSFLLNILDGTMAPENVIFIITSNFPDKLDKALIRPGRIDLSIKLDKCDRYQLSRIYQDLYEKPLPDSYIDRFPEGKFITAEVILHLFYNKFNRDLKTEELLVPFLNV